MSAPTVADLTELAELLGARYDLELDAASGGWRIVAVDPETGASVALEVN